MSRKAWVPPNAANKYLHVVYAAEDKHGLPRNLLARLLYQESRYRDDIISGQVKSAAGAVGIAQIVPRWHPNVDPLDVDAAIFYAAGYLSRLYSKYGDWERALAAYNWGPGNVDKHGISGDRLPTETKNYFTQILNDVRVS